MDGKRPLLPSSLDPRLAKLIEQCWNADPVERPTATQVRPRRWLAPLLAQPGPHATCGCQGAMRGEGCAAARDGSAQPSRGLPCACPTAQVAAELRLVLQLPAAAQLSGQAAEPGVVRGPSAGSAGAQHIAGEPGMGGDLVLFSSAQGTGPGTAPDAVPAAPHRCARARPSQRGQSGRSAALRAGPSDAALTALARRRWPAGCAAGLRSERSPWRPASRRTPRMAEARSTMARKRCWAHMYSFRARTPVHLARPCGARHGARPPRAPAPGSTNQRLQARMTMIRSMWRVARAHAARVAPSLEGLDSSWWRCIGGSHVHRGRLLHACGQFIRALPLVRGSDLDGIAEQELLGLHTQLRRR
jgi:hypothetical protein